MKIVEHIPRTSFEVCFIAAPGTQVVSVCIVQSTLCGISNVQYIAQEPHVIGYALIIN